MLIKRLGYYLIGFSIGLIFLAYFLKEKKTEFCYSANCRVLKNITSKKINFTPSAFQSCGLYSIDTAQVRVLIKKGKVVFSESSPRNKPCALYSIEGMAGERRIVFFIENCEEAALIKTLDTPE